MALRKPRRHSQASGGPQRSAYIDAIFERPHSRTATLATIASLAYIEERARRSVQQTETCKQLMSQMQEKIKVDGETPVLEGFLAADVRLAEMLRSVQTWNELLNAYPSTDREKAPLVDCAFAHVLKEPEFCAKFHGLICRAVEGKDAVEEYVRGIVEEHIKGMELYNPSPPIVDYFVM